MTPEKIEGTYKFYTELQGIIASDVLFEPFIDLFSEEIFMSAMVASDDCHFMAWMKDAPDYYRLLRYVASHTYVRSHGSCNALGDLMRFIDALYGVPYDRQYRHPHEIPIIAGLQMVAEFKQRTDIKSFLNKYFNLTPIPSERQIIDCVGKLYGEYLISGEMGMVSE